MKFQKTYISTAIALALFGTTACGGGGSSGSSSSSSNTQDTTSKSATINLQAIDGYLENATVCIDLNANGLCDNDDIISSNKTDEKGKIQLIAEGDKLAKFNSKASAKVLVEGKKGETLNVALDGTKTELEKDLSLTRTIFPKDFESNDGKVRNVTPYTTLADKVGTTFTSEEDYTNNALKKVAESLGTTLDAIESDFNNLDEVTAEQKQDVIAALLASELLVAEDKLDQSFENLDSLETFLTSDEEIKAIKKTTETKSKELAENESISVKDISASVKNIVQESTQLAQFNCYKQDPKQITEEKTEYSSSYYVSSYTCKPSNYNANNSYSWSVDGKGADCSKSSTDESVYECTFAENAEQNISLTETSVNGISSNKKQTVKSEDALVAKFTDVNQNAEIGSVSFYDSEGKEVSTDASTCTPRNGCIKNLTLDASLNDESVLPTNGTYTYTWSYGNGDWEVIKDVTSKISENQKYHYVQPTEYTQTLTIEGSNGLKSTYTTKNTYTFSKAINLNHFKSTAYYMNFPKADGNFESVILVSDAFDCDSDSKGYCNTTKIITHDDKEKQSKGKITISEKNYDMFRITNTYSTNEDMNGDYEFEVDFYKNEKSVGGDLLTHRIAKNLYADTINVGDLVQFGSNTVIKTSDNSIYYHETPMIWEVMDIKQEQGSNYSEVKLVQVRPKELHRNYLVWEKDFSWSNDESSIRSVLNKGFENNQSNDAITIELPQSGCKSILTFNKYESNIIIPETDTNKIWEVDCSNGNCSYKQTGKEESIIDYLSFLSIEDIAELNDSSCNYTNNSCSLKESDKYTKHFYEAADEAYFLRDQITFIDKTSLGISNLGHLDTSYQEVDMYRLTIVVKVPTSQIKTNSQGD